MTQATTLEERLAAFAMEVLSIEEDPASLAESVEPFKRDNVTGIATIELDSSVGVVAFLIYHYTLSEQNGDGQSGGELFENDRKILERAAKLDTPGPRILAHAVTEDEAYILATSPATHRALIGADQDSEESVETPDLTEVEIDEIRRDTAIALAETLRNANNLAQQWLQAIRAASGSDKHSADNMLEFNEDETALALMLLDDSNVRQLLQVMNVVVESLKHQREVNSSDSAGAEPSGT